MVHIRFCRDLRSEMNRIVGLVIAGTIAVVGLTGCTININSPAQSAEQTDSKSEFSSNDQMFAQMMIPHHQQAVDLSALAPERSTNQEVLELAQTISDEQAPEIEQMGIWLGEGHSHDMGHDMPMAGMVSEADFETLKGLTGTEFDKQFLKLMIAHHEGAIEMVSMIADSENAEVANLGQQIVISQTEQIEYMKELLAGL